MYCTQCGARNLDESKFCHQCGQRLVAPGMPQAAQEGSSANAPVSASHEPPPFTKAEPQVQPVDAVADEIADRYRRQTEQAFAAWRKRALWFIGVVGFVTVVAFVIVVGIAALGAVFVLLPDLARSLGSSNGAGSGLVIVILWLIVGTSLVLKWLWNYAVSIPGLFLRFFMRPSVACPRCGRAIHARINDYATWPASCPRCQQRLAPLEPIYVIT
jgi:hypothetical protein